LTIPGTHSERVIAPELAYVGDRFVRDVAVAFDRESGRITKVGPIAQLSETGSVERYAQRALLPGMVNAHSHAFQRAMRGWTQWRPANEDADFWSWRNAMYRTVLQLSPEEIYQVARYCFIEMLLAGYTTVGEFHYLQRDEQGRAYANPNELAGQVVRAARDAGIRITLLNVCYATGGIGQPLQSEQRRFATPDLDSFLAATDELRKELEAHAGTAAGVAPHSVRAVTRGWLTPIADYARRHQLPLHMHVSEQPAEVEASLQCYGRRPAELLADEGMLSDRFTAVHATHLSESEIVALGGAGVNICVCPTTERDLGDGILPAKQLRAAGAKLCIGSDSQIVIDPWEEIRLLEYHARLATLRRAVLIEATSSERQEVAPVLLRAGSGNGARSLGTGSASLASGEPADFVLVDLEHPALAGWNETTLAAHLALSAPASVVREVWVGGVQRVCDGHHEAQENAQREFNRVCRRVLA
jgi:formimidoylglutamate deiminase